MIKCSKGNVEIKGNLILLEAETVMILRGIRNILEEEYGKKHAEKTRKYTGHCSKCGSTNLLHSGKGVERVEEEIKKSAQEIAREAAKHLMK